jgi:hypothetical protein
MKTSISLPQGLAEEYEQFKDRFNTSRICAAAIKAEIDYQKALQLEGDRMKQTVLKLKREAILKQQQQVKQAAIQAADDFHHLQLDEILAIVEILETLETEPQYTSEVAARAILSLDFELDIEIGGHDDDWAITWAEAIRDTWEAIEAEVTNG